MCRVAARRDELPRLEHFTAGLLLFAIASAAMAAVARAQFGTIQAAQSRYATYTLVYWSGLLVWLAHWVSSMPRLRPSETAVMIGAIAVSGALLIVQAFVGLVWHAKSDNIRFAAQALAAGVDDDEWISTLHPTTSVVYATRSALKATGDRGLLDPAIGALLEPSKAVERCNGDAFLSSAVPTGGWRLAGVLESAASAALIVDGSGIVRGLATRAPLVASPNPSQLDVVRAVWTSVRRRETPTTSVRWQGFAQRGGLPYTFYAVDQRNTVLCKMVVQGS